MSLVAVSEQVADGETVELPNNLEHLEFETYRSGFHSVIWLHGVARQDGRAGATTYRVQVREVQESGELEGEYGQDYAAILHLKQARFLYVTLTEVNG